MYTAAVGVGRIRSNLGMYGLDTIGTSRDTSMNARLLKIHSVFLLS